MTGSAASVRRPVPVRGRRATAWPDHQHVPELGTWPTAHVAADQEARRGPTAAADGQRRSPELVPGTLYRFVQGVDERPTPMSPEQLQSLQDPFAARLLASGVFPMTLPELLGGLTEAKLLLRQRSYVMGEAGQIPPEQARQANLFRDLRYVVIRSDHGGEADLLVSTSAVDPPEITFLQVAAWDDEHGLFNYYMRVAGSWVWGGDSYSALAPESRGRGCFDSHVNGSVVMKELRAPWLHWKSMKAGVRLDDDDPLRTEPLFRDADGAEDLELLVRASVSRWTHARLDRVDRAGQIDHPDWLLRHLCTSTTVNLASSDQESRVLAASQDENDRLVVPTSFWLDVDLLLNTLEIPANIDPVAVPVALYAAGLHKYDYALVEGDFRQPGDTHFAFCVPEPAFEDTEVVRQMVRRGLLTPRLVACVAMVDFPNPVFSDARERLLEYVPDGPLELPAGVPGRLAAEFAAAILAVAEKTPDGSPEREFAANWQLGDSGWQDAFATRLEDYMKAVTAQAAMPAGFDAYVRLAESRRNRFRAMRLAEFTLTLPTTNIPRGAPPLRMTAGGAVTA
ncbi:hypothetical protein [Frankia sp. R43]|uniref:hypothetical protein n=1 Tax=Frankia sp. R43 TaxID=269536 RepID=UPI000A671987|nr:hypothetical protein [Frankia sp. R43]